MKRSVWGALVTGWLLSLSVLGGCGKLTSTPALGGETHWLEGCGQGAALPTDGCGSGLACWCGLCTAACNDDAGCGWLSADAICAYTDTSAPAGACSVGEPPRLCGSTVSTPGSSSAQGATGSRLALTPTLQERWACIEDPPPEPRVPDPGVVRFTAAAFDYRTQQPLSGVSLRACIINDVPCEEGLSEGVQIPPALPGGPPEMAVFLPTQFVGFLRLTAPGYIPYDYYLGGPLLQNVVASQPFLLLTQSSLLEFMQRLGTDPLQLAGLGMLTVQVLDCHGDPAPGVELRLLDQKQFSDARRVLRWSNRAYIPVLNQPTDEDGMTGFLGLPIGNLRFEAVVNGRTFGARTFVINPDRLITGTIRVDYASGL